MTAGMAVSLAHLVGAIPLRQRRLRPCEAVTGPGFIEIKKAGTRTQRINARSIVGATTARTGNGVLFTLSHAERDQPIALEVESEADAERIRHALGIGHGGFGSVGWHTTPSTSAKTGFWGRILTFLIGSAVVGVGFFVSEEAAGAAALASGQFMVLAIMLSVLGYFGRPTSPSVMMAAEGLKLQTKEGWCTVPYNLVQKIESVGGKLRFTLPPPYHFVEAEEASMFAGTIIGGGLGPGDREGLITQIMSAAARARGLGASKDDATGRVDVLRRNGESPRDWLTRLDTAGRMLEASVGGYRGHMLDHEDLWAVLEDPEAEAELRAAAARVLRHSSQPETRVRIDAAVAAVRDESVNRRLRIAIQNDVDDASQELALLDVQDPLPSLRAMR